MIIIIWLCTLFFWRLCVCRGLEWREAFLAALIACGVVTVLLTETLTCFSLLRFKPLVGCWGAVLVVVLVALSRQTNPLAFPRLRLDLTIAERLSLGGIFCILLVTGFIALYSPPNTWDSMTYHLARVAHWVQNGGVMNYPTNILRQLVIPPFAEYSILQAQILTGGDRFANAVQWSALVGCIVGVSLIAREFGLPRAGQIFAALFAATLPMGILQASSTQNDLVTAQWVVAAVFFVQQAVRTGRGFPAILAGSSFGLAVLTKWLGGVLILPFLVAGFFIKPVLTRSRWLLLISFCVGLLFMNAAFGIRLGQLGPDIGKVIESGGSARIGRTGPLETMSNMIRNVGSELATPWNGVNALVVGGICQIHGWLGITANDPKTTHSGDYTIAYFPDEDYMPNPLHMLLVLAAIGFWGVARGKDRWWWFYAAALAAGVIFFCAGTKWQPWVTRFHVSFFMLAAPLVAAVLFRSLPLVLVFVFSGVFFLAVIDPLLFNNTRRILSRKHMFQFTQEQIYFMKHPGEFQVVSWVTTMLNNAGCRRLGLKIGEDDWEYPWHVLMVPGTRIEQVNISNDFSGKTYPLGDFEPCAVVSLEQDRSGVARPFNGRMYAPVGVVGPYTLFVEPKRIISGGAR